MTYHAWLELIYNSLKFKKICITRPYVSKYKCDLALKFGFQANQQCYCIVHGSRMMIRIMKFGKEYSGGHQ